MKSKLKYIALFLSITILFIAFIMNIEIESPKKDLNERENLYLELYKNKKQDSYEKLIKSSDKREVKYLELFFHNSKERLDSSLETKMSSYDTLLVEAILDIENKRDITNLKFKDFLENFDKIENKINLYYLMSNIFQKDNSILIRDKDFYLLYKKIGIYFHAQNFLDDAEKIFIALIDKNSVDVEALGWYGSTLTKFALFKKSPIDKIEYVNRGVQKIELAYEKAPNNLSVRLIRMENYASLPKFFKKTEIAYRDIVQFIKEYKEKKRVEVLVDQNKIELIDIPKREICLLVKFIKENEMLDKRQKDTLKEVTNGICKN
jgi:hypothetical protein